MKLNKTLGRVATTLVAGTMLASLTAVPASAANATVTFSKTINMADAQNASVPSVKYSYAVSAGTPVSGDDNTPNIFAGKASDLSISDITFSPADDGDVEENKITKSAIVTFAKGAYTVPGIYRYTVTETDPEDPDMTCDDDTYTLDVYVINNSGNIEVATAVWTRGTPITPTLDSENNAIYGKDAEAAEAAKITGDEDDYTTYSLTVTKAVEGTMADAGRKYDFTVNLAGLDVGAKVAVDNVKTANGAASDGALSLTGIQLQPNGDDEIVITGLPSDAKYTIIEALNKSEGYTVKVNDTELSYSEGKYSTTEATQGKADASVTVVNKRDAVSPTGIVMDVAPYVLLVVVAAAGCFVFLRKRRED